MRGGGAKISGIGARIAHDLRKNYSETLEVTVHVTDDPVNSNYALMQRMLVERRDELQKYWITRQKFEETGESADLFKPFAFTNA